MGLPFYRRARGRGCGRRRPVHNTNFLEKWLFSIICFEKTIQSIFMIFSGFFYHAKDYCCAFNMFKIELENREFRKSLYFYIVDAGKKKKKKKKKTSCVWVLALY